MEKKVKQNTSAKKPKTMEDDLRDDTPMYVFEEMAKKENSQKKAKKPQKKNK